MKKISLIIIIMCLVTLMAGCYNEEKYMHDYPDLYTEAIYSMLGVNSYFDDSITLIETDDYGRSLFIYQPRDCVFHKQNLTALFVSQYSDKNTVFYYQGINFILAEEYYIAGSVIPFSEDDIENLKAANDWSEDLDLNSCLEREIVRTKTNSVIDNERALEIVYENNLIEFTGTIQWISIYGTDTNNNHVFFIQDSEWETDNQIYHDYESYIIFFNEDGTYPVNNVETIIDILNYQSQLEEFLQAMNWVT